MDKRPATYEGDLPEAALRAVRVLGLDCEWIKREPAVPGGAHGDARVRLRHGGKAVTYHIEVKRTLQPAVLGPALAQLKRLPAPALLVTDYVNPRMAERLRERGVQFIDTAGNAWLDAPPLLVWVKGQRMPDAPKAGDALGRAFQPTGLQVLFALLCKPEIVDRPYRDIAKLAGVAHGTVG